MHAERGPHFFSIKRLLDRIIIIIIFFFFFFFFFFCIISI